MSWEKLDSSTRMGGRRAKWRRREGKQARQEACGGRTPPRPWPRSGQYVPNPSSCFRSTVAVKTTQIYRKQAQKTSGSLAQPLRESAPAQVLGWWHDGQAPPLLLFTFSRLPCSSAKYVPSGRCPLRLRGFPLIKRKKKTTTTTKRCLYGDQEKSFHQSV